MGGASRASIPTPSWSLSSSPGDIIEIEGKRATVAKVWRAEKQDWGQEMIRIDGFTRQNADVGIGERVKVKKATVKDAVHIVLAPPEGTAIQFSGNAVEMIKHQLLKRPDHAGGRRSAHEQHAEPVHGQDAI